MAHLHYTNKDISAYNLFLPDLVERLAWKDRWKRGVNDAEGIRAVRYIMVM